MKYLSLPLLFLSSITLADVNITPGVSLGQVNYSNGITDYTSGTIAANVTVSNSSGFYGDFEFREDGDDEQNLERNTLTFTAGKNFPQHGVTGFFGYQMSETATIGDADVGEQEVYFENSGLFLGAAKSFSLNDSSNFSLSTAIGQMTAELDIQDSSSSYIATTDALGMSLGMAYTSWYPSGFAYSLGAKAQQYSYELEDNDALEDELVTLLYLKLSYRLALK